jgi:hypothetical protein
VYRRVPPQVTQAASETTTGTPASPAPAQIISPFVIGVPPKARSLPQPMGKDRIKNAVLGKTVAERLFGANSDPIGQAIGINHKGEAGSCSKETTRKVARPRGRF